MSLHRPSVPDSVRAAYGWSTAEIEPLAGGLINATFRVSLGGEPHAVVQRLHPIFGARVNEDLDAVTAHVAAKGLPTPRLVRTLDGARWVDADGPSVWRALTWVEGTTIHRVPGPAWAEAGGELVGRFHRAVADLSYDYAFARAGVHDTAAHLARLHERATGQGEPAWIDLANEILDGARALPALPDTRRRHCHGDLKISNLLFRDPPPTGYCLIDLDTLGQGTMAFELGDAMRSWCNPRGEDAGSVTFDLAIFSGAMRGFRGVAGELLSDDERRAIVIGLETVCFELAARFCVDVFADSYFGWDPARFASRREHNLVRARGQLALGTAVRASRAEALDVVLGG
ncbi:MAG: phosphotransferase enzyme family protein [Kofleriaceae bacterium]